MAAHDAEAGDGTGDEHSAGARPMLTGRRVRPRPVGVMRQYERGGDGRFHDGLLMDLLQEELTPDP